MKVLARSSPSCRNLSHARSTLPCMAAMIELTNDEGISSRTCSTRRADAHPAVMTPRDGEPSCSWPAPAASGATCLPVIRHGRRCGSRAALAPTRLGQSHDPPGAHDPEKKRPHVEPTMVMIDAQTGEVAAVADLHSAAAEAVAPAPSAASSSRSWPAAGGRSIRPRRMSERRPRALADHLADSRTDGSSPTAAPRPGQARRAPTAQPRHQAPKDQEVTPIPLSGARPRISAAGGASRARGKAARHARGEVPPSATSSRPAAIAQ